MTKAEKKLKRFLSKPDDFTYSELCTMLQRFGYQKIRGGKSSGSRVAFFNEKDRHIIRLHMPHPRKHLKRYQLDLIEEELKSKGII